MKKVLSFFLAVLLVFGALPLTVSHAAGTPEIKVAEVTNAQRGDTVDVPVSFLNNPGINSYTLSISYDTTRLTLNSVTPNNAIGGSFNYGTRASWINSSDTTYSGVFLTLHFTVLSTAANGKANVSVSYNSGDICNYAEDDVDFTCTAGGVTVSVPCTLTYDANGGSGAPASYTGSGTIKLSTTVPTRSGYEFLGWATSASATTAQYAAGASFDLTADTTLYAVWKRVYTLTYNANGGTGAPASQTGNGTIILSSTVPTKASNAFISWNTKADGTGTSYAPGDSFNLTANTTLYAQWEPIPIELVSIAVTTQPRKLTYYIGDALDTSGMVVTATFSDGSRSDVTNSCVLSPFSSDTVGSKTINISYTYGSTTKTTSFNVTVFTPSITISPSELNIKNENSGTAVISTTPAGQQPTINVESLSHCTVSLSGTSVSVTGISTGTDVVDFVMVYNGRTYTTRLTVNVTIDPKPVRIAITSLPNKLEYTVGEALNTAGMVVTAFYEDGSSKPVTGWKCSPDKITKQGTQTVTVSYTERGVTVKATFDVVGTIKTTVKILTPTRTKIRYLDTLTLHTKADNLPEGATIYTIIEDTSVLHFANNQKECNISEHMRNNRTCYTATIEGYGKGTTTVISVVCDADGNPIEVDGEYIYDSIEITCRHNFLMDIFFFIYVWFTKDYDM